MAAALGNVGCRLVTRQLVRRSQQLFRPIQQQQQPVRRFAGQSLNETDTMRGPMYKPDHNYKLFLQSQLDFNQGLHHRHGFRLAVLAGVMALAYWTTKELQHPSPTPEILPPEMALKVKEARAHAAEHGLPDPYPLRKTYHEYQQNWMNIMSYRGPGPLPEAQEAMTSDLRGLVQDSFKRPGFADTTIQPSERRGFWERVKEYRRTWDGQSIPAPKEVFDQWNETRLGTQLRWSSRFHPNGWRGDPWE